MPNSILIIEDEHMLADNIRTYLERNQWETHVVHSAEEGLRKLKEFHPDIVLTDYQLQGATGLELIKGALIINPNTRIVMLTGEGNVQW